MITSYKAKKNECNKLHLRMIKTKIQISDICNTNGDIRHSHKWTEGKNPRAVTLYWLTKALVPERNVELLRVPPPHLQEQCAQGMWWSKSVDDGWHDSAYLDLSRIIIETVKMYTHCHLIS